LLRRQVLYPTELRELKKTKKNQYLKVCF